MLAELDDKCTRGGVLLDVILSTKPEVCAAMKRDNEIGIWTLDFVIMIRDELMA